MSYDHFALANLEPNTSHLHLDSQVVQERFGIKIPKSYPLDAGPLNGRVVFLKPLLGLVGSLGHGGKVGPLVSKFIFESSLLRIPSILPVFKSQHVFDDFRLRKWLAQ